MTDKQILTKAVEKAVKNGWDCCVDDRKYMLPIEIEAEEIKEWDITYIIFSRNFARAFWGNDRLLKWQYHLQQMVIKKDPIKYLEQFL